MKPKIIITGHTGFIGKPITKLFLEAGWQVIGVSRNNLALTPRTESFINNNNLSQYTVDLSVGREELKQIIELEDCNILLNLAWVVNSDCYNASASTLFSTSSCLNVLQAFVEANLKTNKRKELITTGSLGEYLNNSYEYSDSAPVLLSEDSDDHNKPITIYGVSKVSLYRITEKICLDNNIAFKWPRVFTVFGPDMRDTCLIPSIISAVRNNGFYTIKNGNKLVNFIPVEHVVEDIFELITELPGKSTGAINISNDTQYSIADVVRLLCDEPGPLSAIARDNILITYGVKEGQVPSQKKRDTLLKNRNNYKDPAPYIIKMCEYY